MARAHGLKLQTWCAAALFAAGTLAAQWLSLAHGGWVFVRAAYTTGAWWQLVTAQWVHFGYTHAVVNVVAMGVVLLVYHGWVGGRLQCLALLGGYIGVAAVLALDPNCAVYAGASGALHGLFAGSALSLLLGSSLLPSGQRRRGRIFAYALLVGLAAKLLAQHLGVTPSGLGGLGFATYYPAHEAGAAGGMLTVLLPRGRMGQFFTRPGAQPQKE